MQQNLQPDTNQIHDVVLSATALYFGITSEQLKLGKSTQRAETYKRQICFYLIRKNNPLLSRDSIAKIFQMGKTAVEYGEKCIDNYKDIDSRTLGDITNIQKLIDNFMQKLQRDQLISISECTQQNSMQR